MSTTTPTMFAVIRLDGYGKRQFITLPLISALVDRQKYFVLPPEEAPEAASLPGHRMGRRATMALGHGHAGSREVIALE